MEKPSDTAMVFANYDSTANTELEALGEVYWETSPLVRGDRVFFLSPEGDYAGTVLCKVRVNSYEVRLDCGLDVALHRSMFRKFNALDHLSNV